MSGGGTPRQQMIGLMYLVLLAMLAMNASKDLLNAFVMLEQGIDKTQASFVQANSSFYNTIDKAAAGNKAAYGKTQALAGEVKTLADNVVNLLANQKIQLVTNGDLLTVADTVGKYFNYLDGGGIPLNKDNQDLGATFFLVTDGGKNGTDLVDGINAFKAKVIEVLDNDQDESNDYLVANYKTLFNTDPKKDPSDPEGPEVAFASRISEHLPLASVTANLSIWQTYVRNAEADVIGSIASKMDGSGMVVDKSKGVVQFDNGYVLKGDTVSAKIFLAAYNSKASPKIYIGVVDTAKFKNSQYKVAPGVTAKVPMIGKYSTLRDIRNGTGSFSNPTTETGTKYITGVIENQSSKGTFFTMFKSSYMVAEPSATVAATKMNVFYVGVPNPVSISAPGVASEDVAVSAPGIRFAAGKKNGEYIVTASRSTGKKGVDVVVKNSKSGAVLGKSNFRVKRLPDPVAKVMGQKEGLVSRGKIKLAQRVDAVMENFDFELKVKVSSFTMSVNMGGDLIEYRTKGNKLDAKMKKILSKVKKGNRVYFENVKVKMPGGKPRKVPSIIFKIK
tara:strand:- start:66 stop:1745 length:1680 start_codon:yes stop_codon:yes gene_type:complete